MAAVEQGFPKQQGSCRDKLTAVVTASTRSAQVQAKQKSQVVRRDGHESHS